MFRMIVLRLLESYFRHRWLYLMPMVLMLVLAGVYVSRLKPLYTARGVIYVQDRSLLSSLTNIRDNNSSFWVTPAQAAANEIGELVQTAAFMRAIIKDTDLEAYMDGGQDAVLSLVADTRKTLWILPLGNNQLLISASHEDPQIAFQIANALINNYMNWQINIQQADSTVAMAFFEDLIEQYQTKLKAARDEMSAYLIEHPGPIQGNRPGDETIEISRLQGEIDLVASRYANAINKLEDTQLALAQVEKDVRQTYILIDAPIIPDQPDISLKDVAKNLAVFIGVGVLLTGIAIAGNTLLDRSFRFPIDVVNQLPIPVLAIIPDMSPPREKLHLRIKKFISRKKTDQGEPSQPVKEKIEAGLDIDLAKTS